MNPDEFDIIKVDYWQCPFEYGVPLLTMPNVPKPLSALNPRTLMGDDEWKVQREKCYNRANGKCEICGEKCPKPQAHELYSYNYESRTGVYKGLVALCDRCHSSIHSGRLVTMTKIGSMPTHYFLDIAEHSFRLISQYNKQHGTQLRVYYSYLEALKNPNVSIKFASLIKKYGIRFYRPIKFKNQYWNNWKLIWGSNIIESPYKSHDDWVKQMKKQRENDYRRSSKSY